MRKKNPVTFRFQGLQLGRSILAYTLAAGLTILAAPGVQAVELGPNLVKNGSFEEDADRNGIPDEWTIEWMWTKAPNQAALTPETASDGKLSLHVVVTDTSVPQAWGGRAFQDVPVVSGATYRVSGWMKMKNWQSQAEVEGVAFTGLWHLADGSWTEPMQALTEQLYEGDFEWKRFEAEIAAPEGADLFRLAAWANTGTGEIWFDDIRVQLAK